jgi:hypothetical protein
MPNENSSEPIGGPEPMKPEEGRSILKKIAAGVAIAVGGIVAVALFVEPTRARGASRSLKLKWQQRELEIEKATRSVPSSADTNVAGQPIPSNDR